LREAIREGCKRKIKKGDEKKERKEKAAKIGMIIKKINHIIMKGTMKIWKERNNK
jgi:hypothetical protein